MRFQAWQTESANNRQVERLTLWLTYWRITRMSYEWNSSAWATKFFW
jgi:hypothetical protein